MFSTHPKKNVFKLHLFFFVCKCKSKWHQSHRFVNDLSRGEKIQFLNLYLIFQFWAHLIQQQKKIWCQKYGQMGIRLSDLVENIVGKEEIASYKQFLLFPQCFQNLSVVDASRRVFIDLRVNTLHICHYQYKIFLQWTPVWKGLSYWFKYYIASSPIPLSCNPELQQSLPRT